MKTKDYMWELAFSVTMYNELPLTVHVAGHDLEFQKPARDFNEDDDEICVSVVLKNDAVHVCNLGLDGLVTDINPDCKDWLESKFLYFNM